jgi:hypothetical protein
MKTVHCTVIRQEQFELKMYCDIDTTLHRYFDTGLPLYKPYIISDKAAN